MVHVLRADSTRYAEALGTDDLDPTVLDGVCAACGGRDFDLTRSWVERGLQTVSGYRPMSVRLARCRHCRMRERILPCDALPGKVNAAENVLAAVAEVHEGASLKTVGQRHGVSGPCVAKWIRGLHHRFLDLALLHRHRAILAEPGASGPHLLVPFGTFTVEAMDGPSALPARAGGGEQEEAIGGLLSLLDRLGGPMAAAQLGAERFRQAVLLFRGGGIHTSSFV